MKKLDTKEWERKIRKIIYNAVIFEQFQYNDYELIVEKLVALLASQLEEVAEEVEKMKLNQSNESRENSLTKHKWWFNNGFDSAIDDVVVYLKGKKREMEEN